MSFEALVIAICDRFVSQRAFDLIVDAGPGRPGV